MMYKLYGMNEQTGELEYLNTYIDLTCLQWEAYRVFTNQMFNVFDRYGNFLDSFTK